MKSTVTMHGIKALLGGHKGYYRNIEKMHLIQTWVWKDLLEACPHFATHNKWLNSQSLSFLTYKMKRLLWRKLRSAHQNYKCIYPLTWQFYFWEFVLQISANTGNNAYTRLFNSSTIYNSQIRQITQCL